MNQKSFSVIGAGRVGRALSMALYKRGWTCGSVISRRESSALELARLLNHPPASAAVGDLVAATWIFVCSPDDTLPFLANALAALPMPWNELNVAHTSGSAGAEIFEALAKRGAKVCSLHPATSLSGAADDWRKIGKAMFGIEGGEDALSRARELVHELGATSVTVPPGQKIAYHLACVVVSNYLVTLQAAALQVASGAGAEKVFRHLLLQLSHDTLNNLSTRAPASALTGPIARGDLGTVSAHLEILKSRHPDLTELYVALGRATLKHAPASARQAFEKLFHEF